MARVKKEATRLLILDAAAQVFKLNGFEKTSMDAIRDVAQVSKATLYNYFPSKAELFVEILRHEIDSDMHENFIEIEQNLTQLKDNLVHLAQNIIRTAYSSDGLALRKLMIAASPQSDLGKTCYALGPQKGQAAIMEIFQKAIDHGYLKQVDTRIAECHLRALIESEFIDILHFGLDLPLTDEWVEAASQRAIAGFFAIYGKN